MLDQNTTTVLTTLITVLGTLGGVVLGVVLSNRYVARQEKAKKNSAVTEEVYMLMIQIAKWVNIAFEDMDEALPGSKARDSMYDLKVNHYAEIEPAVDRVTMLVRLYIPQLRKETENLFDDFKALRDSYNWWFITGTRQNLDEEEAQFKASESASLFYKSHTNFLSSLEKLARS